MTYKTLLILPSGQLNIDGELIQYDDNKLNYTIDCLLNPLIPDTVVMMDNQQIGRVIEHNKMDDGLYCKIEFANEPNLLGKYPLGKLETYTDVKGIDYQYTLTTIEFLDKPAYVGHELKEFTKELQMDKRTDPVNFNTFEEFKASAIPVFMELGDSQEDAMAKCESRWSVKDVASNIPTEPIKEPTKKSKIDILSSIKKMIEKNGYLISDEKILEMFSVIQDNNGALNKLNKKLDSSKDTHDIQVFPKKTVYIEKYDEHVRFDDKLFTEMITAFQCEKLFKPYVDLDHRLEEKYADILALYIKPEGLFAKIKLNERGKLAIKNNDYSYISPEWGDRTDTDGQLHKNVLWAITLTNIPALEGENPRLQDQIKLTKRNISNGGNNMPKTLSQRLATLEGKVSTYKLQEGEAPMISPEIMEAIQMIKDALVKIDELTMQNQEVIEEKEAALLEKQVAEKTALETQEQLKAIELEKANADKDAFFELAVKEGRVEPSELEMWQDQYDKSPDFVTTYLSSKTKQEDNRQSTTNTLDNKTGDEVEYLGKKYKLSLEDKKIMAQYNYDVTKESDVHKYIKDVLI